MCWLFCIIRCYLPSWWDTLSPWTFGHITQIFQIVKGGLVGLLITAYSRVQNRGILISIWLAQYLLYHPELKLMKLIHIICSVSQVWGIKAKFWAANGELTLWLLSFKLNVWKSSLNLSMDVASVKTTSRQATKMHTVVECMFICCPGTNFE